MTIPVSVFLSNVAQIEASHPVYQLGQDGSRGSCDCIGLIIGAVRRSGGQWAGSHGSNWAARNRMATLKSPAPLELGGIVFKAHEPGASANQLPSTYQGHSDQRDYYHVGVIVSVSPLVIKHCTSWAGGSGIKVDTKIGVWRYGGRLQGLDYDSEEVTPVDPIGIATVAAPAGKSVRMRANPSDQAIIRANVPVGAQVDVLQKAGSWWEIRYGGKPGWMLASFLDGSTPAAPAVDMISVPRADWEALKTAFFRVMKGGSA